MISFLTSDVMLRVFGGFGVGCALVLAGTHGLFHGLA